MFGTLKHFTRSLLSSTVVAAMLVIAMLPSVALTPVAQAHTLAGSGTYAVDVASPAVVRIVSTITAQLTCLRCGPNNADIVSPPPQSGPFIYYSSGSGAFISPDGYILTADHVVDHTVNNRGDVTYIESLAANEIASHLTNITPDAVLQFLQNNPNRVQIDIRVQSQQAFLSTAYTGQLQNTAQVISYPVTRIVVNSPVDKQDTAILQVQAHDVPYLQLAPTSSIKVQDTVTAIAYPGDADVGDFGSLLNPSQSNANANTFNSLLGASVNTGQITAQKNLSDGTLVYEVNSIATHGSSGGPVINQQGQIIGFVDAESNTGRLNFLYPSEVITGYTRPLNLQTNGAFMNLWTQAIKSYDAPAATPCHWTQASQNLKQLRENYPQFGGVLPFLQTAQTNATPTECPAPTNSSGLIFGGLGLLIVLVVAGIFFFVLRRRKQNPPRPPLQGPYRAPLDTTGYAMLPQQSTPPPASYPAPSGMPGYGMPPQQSTPPPASYPAPSEMAHNGYAQGGMQAGMNSNPPPDFSSASTELSAPSRSCVHGHVTSDRTASFCRECGSVLQDMPVQR